ncbi:hypothetical protein [Streptomyces anulatus]|uniref:hypothetical protein n=1 Tax=Streptomyces anulatus TaxID=1892 RepID=UPI0038667A9B|nr:hypothetical protein OHB50_30720 [Streptomyces anulatus]
MTPDPDQPARRPESPRTERYRWELARGQITAFGESKTLREWAVDERCTITREALRTRLALGWKPADAITTARHDKPDLTYTHAGRTLSLRGWAEQSGIKYHTLYNRLNTSGMTFAEALEKGGDGPHFTLHVTALGETKPLSHWSVDPRAGCAYNTMRRRLAEGWDAEEAIAEEPQQGSTLGTGIPYRAFGLSMGLEDWARHTQIPASTLRHQITQHNLPLEAALTSLGWAPCAEVRVEHTLIRITAAELRPGDHVLGTEPSGTDQQTLLTVRRIADALPHSTSHRATRISRASTNSATPPPPPTAARTSHPSRR